MDTPNFKPFSDSDLNHDGGFSVPLMYQYAAKISVLLHFRTLPYLIDDYGAEFHADK